MFAMRVQSAISDVQSHEADISVTVDQPAEP